MTATEQLAIPEDVLRQIQKIFQLATKNPNEHEAAAAMAKGQELLERYNLTHEALSGAEFGSGARAREAVEGVFHRWQRDLWSEVAALNFVWYWNSRDYNRDKTKDKYNTVRRWKHRHHMVGRKVNISSTIAMATYLSAVATRLARERTQGENPAHTLGQWANSYRYGVVARICRKLRERRNEALAAEEERRAAQMRAADGPTSTSTALALSTYIDTEMDANVDFIYGEGTAARWASERAQQAAERRARQEAYTKWAAEHPEEAAREEAKRAAQAERRSRGRARSHYGDNLDRSAFWSGYDDGANVSIDPQVDRGHVAGRIGR